MGGHGSFDIHSAVAGDEEIQGRERKIYFQVEKFQDREEVKLPEARIERRLEFRYEFAVTVFKTACTFIQHVAVECIREFQYRPKIRVLRVFTDSRRE
jgi:hypothetical protein